MQNGLNALHLASKEGHVHIVQDLLARGAKIDAATKKVKDNFIYRRYGTFVRIFPILESLKIHSSVPSFHSFLINKKVFLFVWCTVGTYR